MDPDLRITADPVSAELGALSDGDQPLEDVLQRTAQLAKDTLARPAEVSVTLVDSQEAHTPVYTGRLAFELDQTQYRLGNGPCLACAEAGQVVIIRDPSQDDRWPSFAPAAVERGVRSTLSVPLPVHRQVIGALNVYATSPETFDDDIVGLTERFAEYAAVAIANTRLLLSAAELAQQMHTAMASRAAIEQAKGILMSQRRIDPDEAFHLLVRMSQRSNRKLRDVARAVVEHAVEG